MTFDSANDLRQRRQFDYEAAFPSSWDLGCAFGLGPSVRQERVFPIDVDGLHVGCCALNDHRFTHEHDRTGSVHLDGRMADGGKRYPLSDAGGSGPGLRYRLPQDDQSGDQRVPAG